MAIVVHECESDDEESTDYAANYNTSNVSTRENTFGFRDNGELSLEEEPGIPGLVALAEHPDADLLIWGHHVVSDTLTLGSTLLVVAASGSYEACLFQGHPCRDAGSSDGRVEEPVPIVRIVPHDREGLVGCGWAGNLLRECLIGYRIGNCPIIVVPIGEAIVKGLCRVSPYS